MKKFSIPSDFKKETIDKYAVLNRAYDDAEVIETYGNITVKNFLGSGRSAELLPEIDFRELGEYIAYSREKGIDFNYTINASHLHNIEFTSRGVLEIMSFLGKLKQAGVRGLTVSLPSLMEIVRESNYDFDLKASVICQITTPNKARMYKQLGVERIVVDESVNRDFTRLKKIVEAFGDKVEIIVNSICHKDCGYRMFHYNQISTDSIEVTSEAAAKYYPHRCLVKRYEDVGNLLRLTWVRPEDIKHYRAIGINYFKLQGRHIVVEGDPARTVESYFKETYDGDLLELFDMFNSTSQFKVAIDNKKLDGFMKPFYEKENFCRDNCHECGYCGAFARKSIEEKDVQEVHDAAKEFFRQYDQFSETVRKATTGGGTDSNRKKPEIDADFDL